MNKEDILKQAILKFGVTNQLDMVIEECAELIKAINKLKRLGGINEYGVKPPLKKSPNEYCLEYYNLCSEVADVEIMLDQLKLMLNKDAVELSKERKLERLKNKLNK